MSEPFDASNQPKQPASPGQPEPNVPPGTPEPRDQRRLRRLVFFGFLINALAIPLLFSLVSGSEIIIGLWVIWLILFAVIWGIIHAISKHILRRRGFRTARIFVVISIFVSALPYAGCMGSIAGLL